jgi:hypothetical protein
MALPKHFFVSDIDGGLYDTRKEQWHKKRPLRKDYYGLHRKIENTSQLKACLRQGMYAWPGGYACNFYTSDGATLCPDCVKEELRNVIDAINTQSHDGWLIEGIDINYEDDILYCAHCSKNLSPEYVD